MAYSWVAPVGLVYIAINLSSQYRNHTARLPMPGNPATKQRRMEVVAFNWVEIGSYQISDFTNFSQGAALWDFLLTQPKEKMTKYCQDLNHTHDKYEYVFVLHNIKIIRTNYTRALYQLQILPDPKADAKVFYHLI